MTTQGTEAKTAEAGANGGEKKPKTTAQTIQAWMTEGRMRESLMRALAGYMSVETFAAQCYIVANTPELAKCSAESVMKAFLECAQMKLPPGAHLKFVALVPRAGVVTVSPQWQGYKYLMEKQPGVKRVTPELVHTSDAFAIEEGVVKHTYDPFDDTRVFLHPDEVPKGGSSGLRGGYLKIEYDEGGIEYHFVSAGKIDRNRRCAETQKLWKQWYPEMVRKTVLRDAWSKRVIPVSPELASALGSADAADNAALGYDPSRVAGMLPARADVDNVPDMASVPDAAPVEVVATVPGSAKAALGLKEEPAQ